MFTLENRKISEKELSCSGKALPTVAVSREGRVFVSYLCGKTDDGALRAKVAYADGDAFDKIAVNIEAGEGSFIENARVWIDPENRLWVMWSVLPEACTKYCVCENADAECLAFGEVTYTPLGTLIARPTICSDGTCLFGSGVSIKETKTRVEGDRKRGAYIGKLTDEGMKICNKLYGNTSVHDVMCLVENNGKIESYLRVPYGIERHTSSDGAATFPAVKDSGYGDYDSRFAVAVLPSGNLLLINTVHLLDTHHRVLTAMLSKDHGRSFAGIMPLYDGNGKVSAPDVCICGDVIYAVYAIDDGVASHVYLSKFTEGDILDGKLNTVGGETKKIF